MSSRSSSTGPSGSMSNSGLLLDIPPSRSPLMQPVRPSRAGSLSSPRGLSTIPQDDVLLDNDDDLEFVAARGYYQDDEEDEDEPQEDDLEDWSLEDGHIVGVAAANVKLNARKFATPEFAQQVLELMRDDLRIPGWDTLPYDLPASVLHIHKVSGALTNAVFFVSIPEGDFDISPAPERATPSSVLNSSTVLTAAEQRGVKISAPTLLLRVYGPSSGSLISRRTELHILHTLSSAYQIGPAVLGTFVNGRVEEYFHSRSLTKEEMRDPRISRWIGRRMRELHSVDLEKMEIPEGPPSRAPSLGRTGSSLSADKLGTPTDQSRPPLDATRRYSSNGSIYSSSSNQSVFSFGTSYASSNGSTASLATINTDFVGTPSTYSPVLLPTRSPMMTPYRGPSEGPASNKRRSRSSVSLVNRGTSKRLKDKLGVWENVTRWTREARQVLSDLDELVKTPGFEEYLEYSRIKRQRKQQRRQQDDVLYEMPLSSVDLVMTLRAEFNLPRFEVEIKQYRQFVKDWEKKEGKSKRVFAHNDTQYGNLLLLTPEDDAQERALEQELEAPHQRIIVVDFEYASANARGYDIANHFVEWQADYHHPTLSHSLSHHLPYPNEIERSRFLCAYSGIDNGYDGDAAADDEEIALARRRDPRIERLEDEIAVWTPACNASWAVWGIVQAKEDLVARIAFWKSEIERLAMLEEPTAALSLNSHTDIVNKKDNISSNGIGAKDISGTTNKHDRKASMGGGAPLTRGKSGERVAEEDDEHGFETDFDYLGYALEKMTMFRKDAAKLGAFDEPSRNDA